MQPDPRHLIDRLGLKTPPIGFYDAPDPAPFAPLVAPRAGQWACMFSFYPDWLEGRTLHLTKDNHGCGGAGSCLFGVEASSHEEMVRFLLEDEGLKRSRELMAPWVEKRHRYRPQHEHLLVGPLRPSQFEHLRTITFHVTPDQLSALVVGAHYDSGPDDPPPVQAPFGSGCSQMLPAFADLTLPRATIGATDAAMRKHLPADTLAFTVTVPMFRQLCELDTRSFLHKSFWTGLQEARAHA